MYFTLFLLSVIAINSVTCYDELSSNLQMYHLEKAEYYFNEFIKKFRKNYGNTKREYRFRVFKGNLEKINALNLRENFNLHGITQFTDMTEEEFSDYARCLKVEDLNMTDVNVIHLDNLSDATYPAELDYRDYNMVTKVKDQGQCRSCYIVSAVGNIEGQYAKNHKKLVSLSEQECLDCMVSMGCAFLGSPHLIMQSAASYGGLATESVYPYDGYARDCAFDKNQIVARVKGGSRLACNESGLIEALNKYGPLSVGIAENKDLQNFIGGHVFNDPTCGTKLSNAVLLIGYGTAPEGPYWLLKNSWGTTWGEKGYIRLARGIGMCAIGKYVATATVE